MKKIITKLLLSTAIIGSISIPSYSHDTNEKITISKIKTELFVNNKKETSLTSNKNIELNFNLLDSKNKLLKDFELEHEAFMHLIVVSSDLESFAHLHPTLDNKGNFKITANKANSDIKNLDANNTFPKYGNYLLFAETKPKTINIDIIRKNLTLKGVQKNTKLVLDTENDTGITKYFDEHSKLSNQGKYKINLETMKMGSKKDKMLHLNLTIEQKKAPNKYVAINNLETWLGMPAHAVLISQKGTTAEEKTFVHLHPGGHEHNHGEHKHDTKITSAKLQFMLMGEDVPSSGIYKIWFQFKHEGKIITAPFIIEI